MKITTNNAPRPLVSGCDVPAKIMDSEFDYVDDDDKYSERFFCYRGSWYDLHEFVRIRPRADAVGFEHGVDADSPLASWHAIQTDSYFSAIVIRLADDDRVIVGRAYS
mgnify:CR=1 FL=1